MARLQQNTDKGPAFGVRHVQILFMSCVGFLMYSTRFGFSVAIVAMTEQYSPNPNIPYYNWSNKSVILSTFFWGYVIPQIAVGILSTKFGTKRFILLAVLMNSLCMVTIPMVAKYFGSGGVMTCRIIQGLAQGFVVPSIHGIFGKWAPVAERSRIYGAVVAGYTLGSVIGLSTTGYICASWAGWPLVFYLFPSLGFIWAIFYLIYGSTSPEDNKHITEAEKNYIQESLKSQEVYNVSIPYRKIITSTPVLAQIFMSLCNGWGFSMITTEMPIYMDKVMKFNISSNGVVSALPQIFTLIFSSIAAIVGDYIIGKHYLSIGNTRKLMSFFGSVGCSILLIIFAYLPTSGKLLSITILIIATSFRAFNIAGYNINHIDLAPNFGAVLMGFVNTSSEIFSAITPIAVQYIVYDETDQHLWRITFLTAAGLCLSATMVYTIFASGEVQSWNYIPVKLFDEKPKEESDIEKSDKVVFLNK